MRKTGNKGFLVLDVLIAGVVLASCIAATMYLFRVGFESLERVNRLNVLSQKALHSADLLKTLIYERPSGQEDLGEGVTLQWESTLVAQNKPVIKGGELSLVVHLHETMLYRIKFSLNRDGYEKSYEELVFRFKPLSEPESGKLAKE
jgi:hypothetical protein